MILTELRSHSEAQVQILKEGVGDSSCTYMQGIFVQGDVKNENRRIYPLREISHAVDTVMERVNSGFSVLGEVDHPDTLNINLDRVSHMITNMWMDGSCGYGKLKLLPTPMGKIIESMLVSGVKLGVSSRGTGDVDHTGRVSGFQMVTVDIVANPSAPNAYPTAIYESLQNYKNGGQLQHLAEAAVHDPLAQNYLSRDIVGFIKDLKI